jgi:hypothetical protein
LASAFLAAASAATLNVPSTQYPDPQTAIRLAAPGDTILVAPGTYTAVQNGQNPQGIFDINTTGITVKSTGGAAVTILQVTGVTPVVRIQANNATLDGFTVQGSAFGVQVISQTPPIHAITGVTVQNLIVNPIVTDVTGGIGINLNATSNSVVDNCDVKNGYSSGISLQSASNNNFIINNTIEQTVNGSGYGFAVSNGNNNVLAGNTVDTSGFGAMTVIAGTANRIERNFFSGQLAGINLTNDSSNNPSLVNYVGKNVLASTDFANGNTFGTGVWVNSNATGNLVFGNVISGFVENGVAVFNSTDNIIQGNYTYRNKSGGIDVTTDSGSNPPTLKPVNNIIQHNNFTDQQSSSLIYIVDSGLTDVGFNVMAGGPDTVVSGSGGAVLQTSSNIRFYRNTVIAEPVTEYVFSDVTNSVLYMNRAIITGTYYQFSDTGAGVMWDAGPRLGGNYWAGFAANGDPSNGSTPFTNFNGGTFTDHYPYQHEYFGRPYQMQVNLPAAGATVAAGSQKTVAWISQGCVFVDIYYKIGSGSPTSIVSNFNDAGFYHWLVPTGLAPGSGYSVQVNCKNSAGSVVTSGVSAQFTVSSSALLLLSPNSDLMANSGGPLMVAWRKSSSVASVDVLYSSGGGAYMPLASGIPADSAFLTVPVLTSNQVSLLIRDANNAGNADSSDGFLTVRGGTPMFTNPGSGSYMLGSEVPVQWVSPQNSAFADLALVNGGTVTPIASDIADFGQYSWLVPDAIGNNQTLQLTFKDINFNTLGTTSSSAFNIVASTGITGPCDVTGDSSTSVADVQAMVNEALGKKPAANDLNGDRVVNVTDVQIVINSVLGSGCAAQ